MSTELYERLHARRADYERALTARFPGAIGPEDAEDLVSEALDRTLTTAARPQSDTEEAWFRRVVFNVAADELRKQRGRAQGQNASGSLRRFVLLSELTEQGLELEDADDLADPQLLIEERLDPERRTNFAAAARTVLDQLDEGDVRLLLIRHVELPDAGRHRCAEAAGLTVEAWRHRYGRAWTRFVDALAALEPTPQCGEVRRMIGELDAGALRNGAAKAARGRVDAHVVECAACRVFARESYKILVTAPLAPTGALALQRVVEGTTTAAGRGSAEIVVGSGAAVGGLVALLSGGGLATGLKVLAIVCTVSVTAAGLCGGIIATYDYVTGPPPKKQVAQRPVKRASKPTPTATQTATATPVAIATRTPTPTRTPRARRTPTPKPTARSTAAPESAPPSAVASGSTGQEFDAVPEQQQSQPAPVPAGVSNEFSP